MNRGSHYREAKQSQGQSGFNEAPIHESGKSVIGARRWSRRFLLQ